MIMSFDAIQGESLRQLVAEVVPSQKLRMNIRPLLNGYGAMDV